ncbi:adenylosuccinate synthetase [uncultured Caudovirales phage]|uniref:Adenylosuccinate synthetase n=1 Tax=uncultured Caudovirales phage TaxID=2100421 RepID=A0A6J5RHS5_9CAUD|nr:adenylosuccinate synthetase [uncultured Caudovirales phage]
MTNIAIIGAAFGDEGKGSIVHHFSPNYDWVVRYSGGANAGHTIYRDRVKYVHNLLPSFDWRHSKTKAFLASGMVIDLEKLRDEVSELALKTLEIAPGACKNIYVDPDAFLVLPEHKEEDKLTNGHIGSTNRGIGPAYKDKVARKSIRIRDVMNSSDIKYKSEKELIDSLIGLGVNFKSILELRRQMMVSSILFEGAQGVMLDLNHGTYPYVSCGDSTVAGIYACGFHFAKLDKVYGVAKCYSTRVGEGPFPTEIHGDESESLRKRGNEYGATTGRPRRVGWIDLPALDYACKKGGITNLIITKFDILNSIGKVPVCIAYDKDPMCSNDFFDTKPQFISVDGWNDASKFYQVSSFIQKIECATGCKVDYYSCGISPKDIIKC